MMTRILVLFAACLAGHGCREGPRESPAPPVTKDQLASLEPSARAELEAAVEAVRMNTQDPEAHGQLALLLHAHGFLDAAASLYVRAQTLDPESARWHRLAAHRAAEAGDETAALERARRAVELDPDSVPARTTLAQLELRRARFGEARGHLRAALERRPDDFPALRAMAALEFRSGNFAEAVSFVERALAMDPNDPNVHYTAALAFERLGETARAQEHLAASRRGPARRPAIEPPPEVLFLRGQGVRAALAAGTELLEQGRYDEAIVALTQATNREPESADAHNALGAALEQAGNREEARLRYEQAVALAPDLAVARTNLGVLLGRLGEFDGAVEHLEAAIRQDPDRADAHVALGVALEAKGRTADAASAFQNAVSRDPAMARAHLRLGVLLGEDGQLDDALSHLRTAIELEPDAGEGHHYLAVALLRRGNAPEAMRHERRAIALAEEAGDGDLLGTARYTLGRMLQGFGEFGEALANLEAARARFPQNTELLSELARTHHLAGDHAAAIESQMQVVSARPGDAEAHYRLGIFFAASGNRPAARTAFEESLRVLPGFAPATEAIERLNRER